MTRHGATGAAVLSALLLLLSAPLVAAAELPQPLIAGTEAVPVPRPGSLDPARMMPIAAFHQAESDFQAGRKEEALRGFLGIAYSGPDDERKGYVWMRVGELLLDRGEFEKALEAADKAVLLSRARYLVLSAMDLKLRIYQKMDWSKEARQVAGYLIDQKYVNANVPALLALMARADAADGKIGSSLGLYRRAVAASTDPEEAISLSTEREFVIDRATELSPLLEAAQAEEDPDVRAHLFLALGKAAARKGFHGMAKYSFERSGGTAGRWAKEAAEHLFRVEKIVSGRPKIVGIVPLTGKLADIGFSVLSGAEVALSSGRLDGQGGGSPVIRWVDTAGDPDKARAEFSAGSSDRTVIGFLGPVTGEEGRAVSAAFGPKSPPVLYMGQKSIVEKPFLYGFGLSPVEEARAVLALLAREKVVDLLLLHPENGYGKGFAEAVGKVSAEAGVRVVRTIGYPPDARDFTDVIRNAVGTAKFRRQSRSKEKGKGMKLPLDGIVIADRWDRVFLLASQLNYYNVYLPLAGFSGWYNEELLRKAGSAVAGAVISVDYSDAIPGSQGDRFRKEFQEAMRSAPTRFEAMGYDGALLLAEAFSVEGGAGKPSVEAMRERIPRLKNYAGVTGTFLFGPAGDMRRKVSLLRVDLGNFVPVPAQ
ncbi:MAG: ABC transporter substrate-binding protein [Deltaproteobacteria bacterium]|nr:ABC transporter substrate-binding protein [Deltaproteobacteria bacterium]